MIELGKGGQRDVADYELSRFACYLIAQNVDPRKHHFAGTGKMIELGTRESAAQCEKNSAD